MIARIIDDERGMAMLVAVGIMLILTTLAFGAIAISESDLLLSARDKESMKALHVADAGIQKALWQLEQFGSSMTNTNFTVSMGNSTATISAIQDTESAWYWTIEATGTSGQTDRNIKVTVFSFSIWNMNMGLSNQSLASGGNGLLGTTSIDGPFYVRGNVQLSGNSEITGGPFFLKTGTLKFMNNSSTLGKAGNPIQAYIEPADGNEDIVDKNNNPLEPGDSQVQVSKLSNQCPNIKIPELDSLSTYRATATSESTEAWSAHPDINTALSGGYKVMDNDGSITSEDTTLTARHTYVIASTVANFGTDDPNTYKEFAWDAAGKKLYINGTVFVDGNLTIGDNANSEINYYGRGTFIVNGEIRIKGKLRPPVNADGKYDMDGQHVLGLVTDETIYMDVTGGNAQPKKDEPDISGAFFATKKVKMTSNNTSFVGSMITGVLDFATGVNNSHLFTHDALPNFLPPSLPGSTKYLAMTASWREID